MCEYFVKADPIQYEQRSRTVRIKNVLTSLRLENMVWTSWPKWPRTKAALPMR
jgi:predicted DNA-binding ribbon-helix-helix protein